METPHAWWWPPNLRPPSGFAARHLDRKSVIEYHAGALPEPEITDSGVAMIAERSAGIPISSEGTEKQMLGFMVSSVSLPATSPA